MTLRGYEMKRWLAIGVAVATFAGIAVLGGCGTPEPAPSSSPSTSGGGSAQPAPAAPALGMQSLNGFVATTATTFSDGVVGVGDQPAGQTAVPSLIQPMGGTTWRPDNIGTVLRFAQGAAESGGTRVMVGVDQASSDSSQPVMSFVAVSSNGSPWQIHEIYVTGSTELRDVASVGDAAGSGPVFMAVGAHASSRTAQLGDPSTTMPVVIASDDGANWNTAGTLPWPQGVAGVQAWSIAVAPRGTAFPGILVAGLGYANDKKLGQRRIGILWQSTDGGQSWKIVSDSNFDWQGRNMTARYIAADASTIVVGGTADVQGASGSPVQTETVEWVAGSDGAWHVIGDGKSLNPGRSSRTTALATRDRGGFITASLLYQTSTGPYKSSSDPAVQILTSGDGISWNNVTTSVPDVDKSSQMMGVAEFGGQDVFFGADQSQGDAVWVVAASQLP